MYNPRQHWDRIGHQSSPGAADSPGVFGKTETGEPLYHLPPWATPPAHLAQIATDSRVLDIGSGTGQYVGQLSQHNRFAVGCDISFALLLVARKNLQNHGVALPRLVQWNGKVLPFNTATFDVVTTNTVLQHVVDDQVLTSLMRESSQVLRTEGKVIVSELASPLTIRTAPHVKLRSVRDYSALAAKCGFGITHASSQPSSFATVQALYGVFAAAARGTSRRERGSDDRLDTLKSVSRTPSARSRFKKLLVRNAPMLDRFIKTLRIGRFIVSLTTLYFSKA